MPKNKGIGGKNRRKGKGITNEPRELVYKNIGQEDGQIIKSLGNGYMQVMCFTDNGNISRRAHIRGTMRKKVWMSAGDIVLVSIRDYQDSVCDIITRYTPDEARILRYKKQLPDNIDINKTDNTTDDNIFVFTEDDKDKDNKKIFTSIQNEKIDISLSDSEEKINLDDI